MLRADIIGDVLNTVWQRFTDALTVFSDYVFIGEIWVAVMALFLVTGFIAIYVPWQWLRSVLGFIVALAIALATGAQLMFNRMRGENKSTRDRVNELENEKKGDHGRWF